jgi:hypothetical protein
MSAPGQHELRARSGIGLTEAETDSVLSDSWDVSQESLGDRWRLHRWRNALRSSVAAAIG